jgi:hypothetical protein
MRDEDNRLSSVDYVTPGGRFVIASEEDGSINPAAQALLSLIPIPYVTSAQAGWERGLHMLARRHDVAAVEVVDRFERELPDIGVITVEDAETGAQVEIDTSNAAFRRRPRLECPGQPTPAICMLPACGWLDSAPGYPIA